MPRSLLFAPLLIGLASPAFAQVKLEGRQWRSDLLPPAGIQDRVKKYFQASPTGGSVLLLVRNAGGVAVQLVSLEVDGRPIERLHSANEVSWWRLLPGSLPPGRVGSLCIRYKKTPQSPLSIVAGFSDGSTVRSPLAPGKDSPGFRIESVGFAPDRSKIVVYFRKYGALAGDRVEALRLDGRPVRTQWLSQSFWNDLAGAELFPEAWPAVGSHIHLEARAASGSTASYVLRTGDGFVQTGVYDEPRLLDPMSLARSGMSTVGAHRHFRRDQLDFFRSAGMRVTSYSDGAVPAGDLLHPAHDVLYVFDEPDYYDYVHWDKNPAAPPDDRKAGYYGPQVVAAAERIRHASQGKIQAGVVVDLTYTPTNWYEYGEACDVILQDSYVMTSNVPMDYLLAAVSTTLSAAAPVPQIHAYECTWLQKPDKFPGFNRPKTAGEFRRIMLMPLGAGAKGLIGWWNVLDEAPGQYTTHKVTEFPDQWLEQSTIYATVSQLAPLIAIGQPFYGIATDNSHAWIGGLLAGRDAALITVVNEDLEYSTDVSLQRPLENISVKLPAIPWMRKPVKAVRVNGFEQFPVEMKVAPDGAATVLLPRVAAAEIVLLTTDAELPGRLQASQQAKLGPPGSQARRLLDADWATMRKDGRAAAILRDLKLNRYENLVACSPVGEGGGYFASAGHAAAMDNPRGDTTNAIRWQTVRPAKPLNLVEWGLEYHDRSRQKPKPVGMSVPIAMPRAGRVVAAVQVQYGNGEVLGFDLVDAHGAAVKDALVERVDLPNRWIACELHVPGAGAYSLRITETGPFPGGNSWGSKWSYVVPGMTLEQIRENLPPPSEYPVTPLLSPRPDVSAEAAQLPNRTVLGHLEAAGARFIEVQGGADAESVRRPEFANRTLQDASANAVQIVARPGGGQAVTAGIPLAIGPSPAVVVFQAQAREESLTAELQGPNGRSIPVEKASIRLLPATGNWYVAQVAAADPGQYRLVFRQDGSSAKRSFSLCRWTAVMPAGTKFMATVTALREKVRIAQATK